MGDVGRRKDDAVLSELIELRGADIGGAVKADVGVAEVIAEDDDDVGSACVGAADRK